MGLTTPDQVIMACNEKAKFCFYAKYYTEEEKIVRFLEKNGVLKFLAQGKQSDNADWFKLTGEGMRLRKKLLRQTKNKLV